MKRNKNRLIDLETSNQELIRYTYAGYDLYFLHGWFTAYLSAPNDSEEDLLIPDYLIIDESRIDNEASFSKTIDLLVDMYSGLAEALFDDNKPICPLIDFSAPTFFDTEAFTSVHFHNLLKWLYGYLAGFMAIGVEISESIDEDLVNQRFYPALFTLCVAFFYLERKAVLGDVDENNFKPDYEELARDLQQMWESQEGEADIDSLITAAVTELDLKDIAIAVNDIFYVVRRSDELKLAKQSINPLLGKLTTNH